MVTLRGMLIGILVAGALLLGSMAANAQEMMAALTEEALLFQEIPSVYGASKFEQKVNQAPSSVSIVISQDIKRYGYRTLADILRSVPGFFVTYDRDYSYVGVRGFGRPGDYNTRVLLLIDGHRTNDNIYNQALIGTEGIIDVDLIDRVEIIRGPGSSLYGSNAFFGVINVITRRGRDLKGAELSTSVASFDTYAGRASYGNRYPGGSEVIASATAYDSKGDRLYFPQFDQNLPGADGRATNNGNSDNSDYDRTQKLFSTVAFGDFTLQGAYSSRTKGIPTGAFGTDFNDPQSRTIDTRSYLDLKYEHGLGARTDLTVRLFTDYYQYTGDYAYFQTGGSLNKDVSYGSWAGTEVKLVSRIGEMQRLITGVEYQGSFREDQKNYYYGTAPLLDDIRRSRIIAGYLQDEIAFSQSLILNAGVRYDHYSTFGGTANPRLALIATPAEKSTIKLLYGSAFRAPNDFELYYQYPALSVANPLLKPEKIRTYEVVYEQYLGDHLRSSLSGYYYRIKDLINYGTDPISGLGQYQNLDEVTARGAEFELDGKWANGVEGRVSYTVQRTKDVVTGEPLTNSPAQAAKAAVTVPVLAQKVFAGIEEQYLTKRRTEVPGNYASAVYLTNLTLFAQNIVPRLEVSASIYNLLDKNYDDPVSFKDLAPLDMVRQDGRTYRLKLTYAF